MIWWAFLVLSGAVGLGIVAAVGLSMKRGRWSGMATGLAHGTFGLAGLALLVAALAEGPVRGTGQGMAGFGTDATYVLGVALLFGLVMAAGELRGRRPPVLLAGLHATIAILGFLMLVAYVSAPPG